MATFGRSWIDEPTDEEKYEEITGHPFQGTKKELEKEIEKTVDNNWTSKTERRKLIDLQVEIDSNKPSNK